MAKVILNKCYGGFHLSKEAYKLYAKKKFNIDEIFVYEFSTYRDTSTGQLKVQYKRKSFDDKSSVFDRYFIKDYGQEINRIDDDSFYENEIHQNEILLEGDSREDPILIEVVKELGDAANGYYAQLEIVDIPDELVGNYTIDEYDGVEILHQKVQEW